MTTLINHYGFQIFNIVEYVGESTEIFEFGNKNIWLNFLVARII